MVDRATWKRTRAGTEEKARTERAIEQRMKFAEAMQAWLEQRIKGNPRNVRVLDLADTDLFDHLPPPHAHIKCGIARVNFRVMYEADQTHIVLEESYGNPAVAFGRYALVLGDDSLAHQLSEQLGWWKSRFQSDALWVDCLAQPVASVATAVWHGEFHPYAMEVRNVRTGRDPKRVIAMNEVFLKVNGSDATLVWRSQGEERRLHPQLDTVIDFPDEFALPLLLKKLASTPTPSLSRWSDAVMGLMEYVPRLVYKGIVVNRAVWTMRLNKLPTDVGKSPADAFIAWNLWRLRLGMPRRVFARQKYKPGQRPQYVDFCAVTSLGVLSQLSGLPENAVVEFVEMLPTSEQTERAPDGHRYAVQFAAAVDWDLGQA
jgi:hypothetical protein